MAGQIIFADNAKIEFGRQGTHIDTSSYSKETVEQLVGLAKYFFDNNKSQSRYAAIDRAIQLLVKDMDVNDKKIVETLKLSEEEVLELLRSSLRKDLEQKGSTAGEKYLWHNGLSSISYGLQHALRQTSHDLQSKFYLYFDHDRYILFEHKDLPAVAFRQNGWPDILVFDRLIKEGKFKASISEKDFSWEFGPRKSQRVEFNKYDVDENGKFLDGTSKHETKFEDYVPQK